MAMNGPVGKSFRETMILSRMFSSACDVVVDGIDPRHASAESGKTFAQNSTAATDVLCRNEKFYVKFATRRWIHKANI